MTDLTPIIAAILTLLGAVVSVFVIPVLRAKLSTEKRQELLTWVQIAVKAAEQLAKAGIINPEDRKQHVLDFLHKNGFNIDLDEIEEMIQSIVVDLPPLVVKTTKSIEE